MTAGEVYISGIFQNQEIGDRLGLRKKYLGEEWEPARFEIPIPPPHGREARERSNKGYKIRRDQFPEAVAVWDEKAFERVHDFLWAGPFLAVKEKIADVLLRFDLGGGELVPVPLYKADLATPWEEPFYYINYGGPKDTLLPEESRSIFPLIPRQPPSKSTYRVVGLSDDDIALSSMATEGADIWIEKYVFSKLFLSGALVDALLAAKIDVDLGLAKCQLVEN